MSRLKGLGIQREPRADHWACGSFLRISSYYNAKQRPPRFNVSLHLRAAASAAYILYHLIRPVYMPDQV